MRAVFDTEYIGRSEPRSVDPPALISIHRAHNRVAHPSSSVLKSQSLPLPSSNRAAISLMASIWRQIENAELGGHYDFAFAMLPTGPSSQ
jgi:hypothetical protein